MMKALSFSLDVNENIEFQKLFHSLLRVLFTFPSRYFFTIDHRIILRLRGWSPYLQESSKTLYSRKNETRYTGLSPYFARDSILFYQILLFFVPFPLSLATTYGVSFDVLSFRYLDVSVP